MNDAHIVFEIKGKQYTLIKNGDVMHIPFQSNAKIGDDLVFSKVLRQGDRFGHPYLDDMKIIATVIKHGKNKKIFIMRYKAKKRNKRVIGHRALYTRVSVRSSLV